MPFKSKAQAKFLFAVKPKIAEEFAKKTLSIKKLPNKIHKIGSTHDRLFEKQTNDRFGYYKRKK